MHRFSKFFKGVRKQNFKTTNILDFFFTDLHPFPLFLITIPPFSIEKATLPIPSLPDLMGSEHQTDTHTHTHTHTNTHLSLPHPPPLSQPQPPLQGQHLNRKNLANQIIPSSGSIPPPSSRTNTSPRPGQPDHAVFLALSLLPAPGLNIRPGPS